MEFKDSKDCLEVTELPIPLQDGTTWTAVQSGFTGRGRNMDEALSNLKKQLINK